MRAVAAANKPLRLLASTNLSQPCSARRPPRQLVSCPSSLPSCQGRDARQTAHPMASTRSRASPPARELRHGSASATRVGSAKRTILIEVFDLRDFELLRDANGFELRCAPGRAKRRPGMWPRGGPSGAGHLQGQRGAPIGATDKTFRFTTGQNPELTST